MDGLGIMALTLSAIFFGAAIYINFAEHPARMGLDTRSTLLQWEPSYRRGFAMQATLAVASAIFAGLTWWQTGNWQWLVGGAVILANWPFTLIVIMPVNHQLQAIAPDQTDSNTRALLVRWGQLHAVRSGLSAVSTIIFISLVISA